MSTTKRTSVFAKTNGSSLLALLALAILICFIPSTASAQLARVGPTNPANGFPFWYQDNDGLALDLCLPNAAELQSGVCLLFDADIPNPTSPISFPNNFPEEAFWWNGTATMPVNGGKATLVLGLEAAFALGGPVPGDQIVFARLRIVADVPSQGDYTVTTPFGTKTFTDVAPGKRAIFYTDDIGIAAAPGDFSAALQGHIGPFLRPSATPGGSPLPFIVMDGKTYIADGATPQFVTGSPFGTNTFKIEGPDIGGPGVNVVEINQFTIMGKVHLDPIPSPLGINRATYVRDGAGAAQIDVFATATAGIGKPSPVLSMSASGVGTQLMAKDKSKFYVNVPLTSSQSVPATVTVTNNSDVPPSVATASVVDEVRITKAVYDAGNKTLAIEASSSDKASPPDFVAVGYGALSSGKLLVDSVNVPPVSVTVISTAGGTASRNISIIAGAASGGNDVPIASDDNATTLADTAVTIDVLSNDTATTPLTARLLSSPSHGVALLNADNTIAYTPNAAYSGNDSFTYIATDGNGVDSNIGTVNVVVTFVNHAPAVLPDNAITTVLTPITINVLANDSDPDPQGSLQASTVKLVTLPGVGTASVDSVTGAITYTPGAAASTVTFRYTVKDDLGLESLPATVTVTVSNPDTITLSKVQYRANKSEWTITGTTSVPGPGNKVTIHIGPTLSGPVLAIVDTDVAGAFKFAPKTSTIRPDSTNTLSFESSKGGKRLAVAITN